MTKIKGRGSNKPHFKSEGHGFFSGKTRRLDLIYRHNFGVKIFLFRYRGNGTPPPTPEIID